MARCDVRQEGTCGPLFGDLPVLFAVEPEKSITSGVWRTDMHPSKAWAGKMTDAVSPVMHEARGLIDSLAPKKYSSRLIDFNNDPSMTLAEMQSFLRGLEQRLRHLSPASLTKEPDDFELEIYDGGTGVIRSYDGWFAVSKFTAHDSALRFQIDTSREVAPSEVDRQILRRADAILASDAVWNRADNRICPAGAKTWSIYCALHDASIEVAGGFSHRRPAMELVRTIIDERSKGKDYHHRLMGYNNDSTTHLSDVRSVFAEALERAK